ncbi:hypothetical protein RA262_27995, partial [Pseudomonas syringae pv. tagetis]
VCWACGLLVLWVWWFVVVFGLFCGGVFVFVWFGGVWVGVGVGVGVVGGGWFVLGGFGGCGFVFVGVGV